MTDDGKRRAITRRMAALMYAPSDAEALTASRYLARVASDGPVEFLAITMGTAMAVANVMKHRADPDGRVDLARIVSLGPDGESLPDSHPGLNSLRVIVALNNDDADTASAIVHTFIDRIELHGNEDQAVDDVAMFVSSLFVFARSIVQALDPDGQVVGLHASFDR